MDTAPKILKQKIFCRCCKNIHTIIVNSQSKTEKKLIINMNPVIHVTTKQPSIIQQNKPQHRVKTVKS